MAGTWEAVRAAALVAAGRRREGALIGTPWLLLRRGMIGETPSCAAFAAFGEKKPELLQARVESTMEAVEETIGAKTFSLGVQFNAELCCAAIFFVNELELCL
jgi:hypothetical protein